VAQGTPSSVFVSTGGCFHDMIRVDILKDGGELGSPSLSVIAPLLLPETIEPYLVFTSAIAMGIITPEFD